VENKKGRKKKIEVGRRNETKKNRIGEEGKGMKEGRSGAMDRIVWYGT